LYECRVPLKSEHFLKYANDPSSTAAVGSEKLDPANKRNHDNSYESKSSDNNVTAQRKVAQALLTMVKNEHTASHFVSKGFINYIF
jgi:hypothetical protein